MMPRAICEDCGSLVEAELTHNGICAVGHYVHCGWGHQLSPDDLISDDVAEIISKLEAKLAKTVEALEKIAGVKGPYSHPFPEASEGYGAFAIVTSREALAEIKGEIKGESHE
jgi:hypothetical protein